jgi:hypothetical protein
MRGLAGQRDLDVGLLLAQDAQRFRQPHQFPAGEEADHKCRLLRPRGAARGFAGWLKSKSVSKFCRMKADR